MNHYILIENNTIVNRIVSNTNPAIEPQIGVLESDFTSSLIMGGVWNEIEKDFISPFNLINSEFTNISTSSISLDLTFTNPVSSSLNTSSIEINEAGYVNEIFEEGNNIKINIIPSTTSSLYPLEVLISNNINNIYGESLDISSNKFSINFNEI